MEKVQGGPGSQTRSETRAPQLYLAKGNRWTSDDPEQVQALASWPLVAVQPAAKGGRSVKLQSGPSSGATPEAIIVVECRVAHRPGAIGLDWSPWAQVSLSRHVLGIICLIRYHVLPRHAAEALLDGYFNL